jgi:hypothetical protein
MSEHPSDDTSDGQKNAVEHGEIRAGVLTLVPVPEGAIATSVVEVVEYLDANCERAYGVRFSGSSSVATVIGLLELAKRNVIECSDLGSG